MRKSIIETLKNWAITLHDDMTGLRSELEALRTDIRALSAQIALLNEEVERLKERESYDGEDLKSDWEM
ncbi:MAG: hypothetical protein L0226_02235 [Acidobacteria bacterium]|nr:hypothetical protein [Acidobacteriota bacterium]MCI0665368.1 hypothetical protein [Acidobacteriota bacterium]